VGKVNFITNVKYGTTTLTGSNFSYTNGVKDVDTVTGDKLQVHKLPPPPNSL
jgi:hypothetical protein